MFVCLCNGVTDRDIRKAVNKGASSVADLRVQLGVANNCGSCIAHAEEVIDEEQFRAYQGDQLWYAVG